MRETSFPLIEVVINRKDITKYEKQMKAQTKRMPGKYTNKVTRINAARDLLISKKYKLINGRKYLTSYVSNATCMSLFENADYYSKYRINNKITHPILRTYSHVVTYNAETDAEDGILKILRCIENTEMDSQTFNIINVNKFRKNLRILYDDEQLIKYWFHPETTTKQIRKTIFSMCNTLKSKTPAYVRDVGKKKIKIKYIYVLRNRNCNHITWRDICFYTLPNPSL